MTLYATATVMEYEREGHLNGATVTLYDLAGNLSVRRTFINCDEPDYILVGKVFSEKTGLGWFQVFRDWSTWDEVSVHYNIKERPDPGFDVSECLARL